MKLNSKTTVLLTVGFFVISAAFIATSLMALRRSQTDNLDLFKNEFTQTTLELFQNSSDLFYKFVDNEIADKQIQSRDDVLAYMKKIDPDGRSAFLIDLKAKTFVPGYDDPRLAAIVTPQDLNDFLARWTLNQTADFSIDNIDAFVAGDASIIPTRVRLKIYEPYGLIIGYGGVFETGKIRIQFIQEQNASYYRAYLLTALEIFLLVIVLIPALAILLMRRVVIGPIKKLRTAAQQIAGGSLSTQAEVASKDEIGELAASFNQMTKKLLGSQRAVEAKMRELSGEHGKLSALVEGVKLGVVMVDLNLRVILSNSAARAVLGGSPDKVVTFKDLTEKIKGKVDISQALSYYVKSSKPLNIQEVAIGDRYYRLFMSPVRDLKEKIFIGAVFVMEDITDEKKINQMRTEIVSVTSHQLRTPATIIKGNLEMVLGGDVGKITKKQRELLDDTYMGNERMIRLVNDLMDASKIDEGGFVFPTEPIDLGGLVAEVVKEVAPFAVKKRVALSLAPPAPRLALAKINRQKVKQVIQNLIDNAIKYSAVEDRGRVEVAVAEDGKFLKVSVDDNGIGVPPGDKDKLFERFYRGSNSTKLDPGGGTGLGLYIAKGVVEQGGGKIWFEGKEGGGTTFYATFPINN